LLGAEPRDAKKDMHRMVAAEHMNPGRASPTGPLASFGQGLCQAFVARRASRASKLPPPAPVRKNDLARLATESVDQRANSERGNPTALLMNGT
jgi:hypothetical protein